MKHKTALFLGATLLCVTPAIADQTFFDDIIGTQSLCVGQDCNNGENFGFDTVILKENNLRIYFHDTSNSASFPTNDWQLIANDSTNGGDNHFSVGDVSGQEVPFRIEAGAESDALTVASNSRLGLGTRTPLRSIHSSTGDTPGLRLEQNTSQGWEAYSWDITANESQLSIGDASAGTTPFTVEAGAVDGALVVHADGNATIAGTLAQGSSRSIKHVHPLGEMNLLNKVQEMEIARWQYKNDSMGNYHIGPMAEDFFAAFGLGRDDKHISSSDIAGVSLAASQALATELKVKDQQIAELRAQNASLEARMQRLEKALLSKARTK